MFKSPGYRHTAPMGLKRSGQVVTFRADLPAQEPKIILATGHISILRNPDIAHVLYLRGLMEKAGRGTVLMYKQCEANNLPAPVWQSDPALGVRVTFQTGEVTEEVTGEVMRLLHVMTDSMKRSEIQNQLNDPFEFLAADLLDPRDRQALTNFKAELAATKGMICINRSWSNPLLWGHYAEKHTGMALGFDIPDDFLLSVYYTGRNNDIPCKIATIAAA